MERERFTFRAGALVRRHARAYLDLIGAEWVEHKGWTSSTFVVTGTYEQWRQVVHFVAQFSDVAS